MMSKIFSTLLALVLVSSTLYFFVSKIQEKRNEEGNAITYTPSLNEEESVRNCNEYRGVYESSKLKEYYSCFKEGDTRYKLEFLRHVLTITEYENTLAKYGSTYTQQQAYGLVQITLNEISASNTEMYDESYDVMRKIESEFFGENTNREKLSYDLFSLFGYQDFDYNFTNYGKGYVNIYYCINGMGAGVRNEIVKTAEKGVVDIDDYQLIDGLIRQMQLIYGPDVNAEGRDGITVLNKKLPFEIKVYLHKDYHSAACCPDLFVKCKTKDFKTVIEGSIKFCHIPEGVDIPEDQYEWQTL